MNQTSTNRTARVFPFATATLLAATILAAIFGASGSLVTLWPTSPVLALILAGVFVAAPLLATGIASAFTHMSKTAKPMAFAAILALVALDSAANVRSWSVLQDFALEQQANTERTAHLENLEQAQSRLKAAQDKLNSVPLPDAEGSIRRVSTYETITAPMIEERDAAKVQVDTLSANELPKAEEIIPLHLAWVLFSGLSACLVAAFGLLADARKNSARGVNGDQTDGEGLEFIETLQADLKDARSRLHYAYRDRAKKERRIGELEQLIETASHSGGRIHTQLLRSAND